jgi:hypothetical protein
VTIFLIMGETAIMKIKSLLLAAAVVTLATGGAFAQQSGGSTTVQGSSAGQNEMSTPRATANNPARQTQEKDESPASHDAGVKQEK